MTTCAKPKARNGRDQQSTARLVWSTINPWVTQSACGAYRLERFVPGILRDIDLRGDRAARYRILKRAPDWWSECAPSEADLEVAQRSCEQDARLNL